MIADSSVLIFYARIHRLDLLHAAAGPILVPAEVRRECVTNAPGRPGTLAIAAALETGILRLVEVEPQRVAELRRRHPRLHPGEASVLAGALQRRERFVLLDDMRARSVARLLGLHPLGCPGVLLRARAIGLTSEGEAEAVLADLVASGYQVSAAVTEQFRRLLAVQPRIPASEAKEHARPSP